MKQCEMIRTIDEILEEGLIRNNEINKAISSGDSVVQKFYDNTVVFLTGGSGFVGKQLIEKLIRSCNIRKIYVLLRIKKGRTVQERLSAILKDPVYEDLHKKQPNFVNKLIPIEGDSEEINLGIDEKNWKLLSDEVNVIFHAAATINFRESMKTATLTNVRGTREMLSLAKSCKQIKSVVHVSTAYAYATRNRFKKEVKEEFYDSPISPGTLIDLAENVDDDTLTSMMSPLMRDWPNIYTFTKAVAEELVRVTGEDLPICVVRPAIVISANHEPCPGWVDVKNAYGPSGLILGMTLGITHTILARDDISIDLVPVDILNNAIIAAARETRLRYDAGDKQTRIYTVTGSRKPITWGEIRYTLDKKCRTILTPRTLWYCFVVQTRFKFIYFLLSCLFHYIPGAIIDGLCMLIGQRPRFFNIYKLANSISSVFVYFTNNDWIFEDKNTLQLYNKLSQTDKIIYNCDMSSVNLCEQICIWVYGVGRYIIKDDLKSREYAFRKQAFLKVLHYILFPLYLYALFKVGFILFSFLFTVFAMSWKYVCSV